MPGVSRKVIFNAPIDLAYQAITEFESYPDFLTDVVKATILETWENEAEVEFNVNVIKKIRYVLHFILTPPHKVEWHLVEGEMMRSNNGSWELFETKKGVEAVYSVDVGFGPFVPKSISHMLVEANLPSMMESFQERVEVLKNEKKNGKVTRKKKSSKAKS